MYINSKSSKNKGLSFGLSDLLNYHRHIAISVAPFPYNT